MASGWWTRQEGWAEGGGTARFVPLADYERAHRPELAGVPSSEIDSKRRIIDTETGDLIGRTKALGIVHGTPNYFETKAAEAKEAGKTNPLRDYNNFVDKFRERMASQLGIKKSEVPVKGNQELKDAFAAYKKLRGGDASNIGSGEWDALRDFFGDDDVDDWYMAG